MLIINADRVSFATASLAEVRPENGSGSEPIAEAATSSVYTTTAGDGGGSGRAGDGSSDAKAGCPGAGGRRETDAARVVLLKLDTSLGLRSRSRKGVPPRPRPRPPRPPPRRGRETTIFLRDRSNACGVWGVGLSPPLVDSKKRNVSRRNTTKALQKYFRRLEEIYDQKRRKSLPSVGNFNCSVICSVNSKYRYRKNDWNHREMQHRILNFGSHPDIILWYLF